jgi:hypothetical protein
MSNVFPPKPDHPSVIQTRQNILDAFTLQLHKMDFSAITVSDITRQANINRSTFYAHFFRLLSCRFVLMVYRMGELIALQKIKVSNMNFNILFKFPS